VHVDPDLGVLRVTGVVSAVDGGRILNQKTARSQIIGATPAASDRRCSRKRTAGVSTVSAADTGLTPLTWHCQAQVT
jgi:hypothetical protein